MSGIDVFVRLRTDLGIEEVRWMSKMMSESRCCRCADSEVVMLELSRMVDGHDRSSLRICSVLKFDLVQRLIWMKIGVVPMIDLEEDRFDNMNELIRSPKYSI
ncbi:hypothetical protein PsorP6_002706 [Peronosclerospora sorghi]|uniref:Uncharacterized protein n=1 Tax=Peronosclerospora sorghi TaxID=230839 RepID=A0ACC0WW71_9STRA|nr:hypothetical protein PsorP6_002706 [Peronosclerospora sorghi]